MGTVTAEKPCERASTIHAAQRKDVGRWLDDLDTDLPHLVKMIDLFGKDDSVFFKQSIVSVDVYIAGIMNLKQAMARVHSIMRKAGYKPSHFASEYIEWYWRVDEEPKANAHNTSIQIKFGLSNKSVCKKVKVGTKEVDVFELQCDGKAVDVKPEVE